LARRRATNAAAGNLQERMRIMVETYFIITLPAGGDCVSVANALDGWIEYSHPVVSKKADRDRLTGKTISPAEYSGVEVLAPSKENVEKILNDLKIPFESVEAR